jgi:hypothetical protein
VRGVEIYTQDGEWIQQVTLSAMAEIIRAHTGFERRLGDSQRGDMGRRELPWGDLLRITTPCPSSKLNSRRGVARCVWIPDLSTQYILARTQNTTAHDGNASISSTARTRHRRPSRKRLGLVEPQTMKRRSTQRGNVSVSIWKWMESAAKQKPSSQHDSHHPQT